MGAESGFGLASEESLMNMGGGHYCRDKTHRRMACKNEDEVDDGRRRHYAPSLRQQYVNCFLKVG